MPTVPRYESRVSTAPLNPPTARAPGPNGLAELGAGISKVADAAEHIGSAVEKAADEAREIDVRDFETEILQLRTKMVEDRETGFRAFKGKAAVENADKIHAAFRDEVATRAERFTDRKTRETVDRMLRGRFLQFDRETETFAGDAFRDAKTSSLQGRAASITENVVRNRYDVELVETDLAELRRDVIAAATSPEEGEATARRVESAAREAILRRTADEDPDRALDDLSRFEGMRGALEADTADRLRPGLLLASKKKRIDVVTNAILAEHVVPELDRMDEDAARAALATAKNPRTGAPLSDEEREQAREALDRKLESRRRVWAERQDGLYEQGLARAQGTENGEDGFDIGRIDGETEDWLRTKHSKGWEALQKRQAAEDEERRRQAKSRAAGRGKAPRTKEQELIYLTALQDVFDHRQDWNTAGVAKLAERYPALVGKDLREVGEIVAKLKEDPESDGNAKDFEIARDGALAKAGLTGARPGTPKYAEAQILTGKLDEVRAALYKKTGKHPPIGELQPVVDKLIDPAKYRLKTWYGGEKVVTVAPFKAPAGAEPLEDEPAADAAAPAPASAPPRPKDVPPLRIPAEDRFKIGGALRRKLNRDPTEDEIRALYLAAQQRHVDELRKGR